MIRNRFDQALLHCPMHGLFLDTGSVFFHCSIPWYERKNRHRVRLNDSGFIAGYIIMRRFQTIHISKMNEI